MAGIIEIWRRETNALLPVRFTVGEVPCMSDGEPMADGPEVGNIDFRETGAFAGKRMEEQVFCISFVDSFVQRFIPANEVIDIAYETKKADAPKTPGLEA